jgi:regulatory protein
MGGTGDTARGAAPSDGTAWDDPGTTDDAWAPADDGGTAWSTDASEPTAWAGDPGSSAAEGTGSVASVWDDDAPAPATAWADASVAAARRGGSMPPARSGATSRSARAAARSAAAAAPDPAAPAVELDASPLGATDDPGVPRLDRDERRRVADELRRRLAGASATRSGGTPVPVDEGGARSAVVDRDAVSDRDTVADLDTAADFDAVADLDAPAPDRAPTRGRGRGRQGGGRGRSGGGGRGRAPATEPPASGSAAVDAEPDQEQVARSVALRLLTGAPRSRAQLAEAMAKRDVPEEVADRVLDRFTEVGLVDDAAYAEILVRSRHSERGLSRRALSLELRRRGVDDETAQQALAQVDDDDEEQAARALARKKLASTRGLDREVRLRRAYGALGRRGYGGSLVSRVVREELAAEGQDADPGEPWPGGHDHG